MDIIQLFEKLLSFKSITPDDDGAFDFIEGYMDGFDARRMDIEEVKNLLLVKKFGEGPHLCFAGHIDVVPPGDGWSSDPFEPTRVGDEIIARGTQDMKSGVAAFLYACHHAQSFNGTISILLTSDEEGDAKNGTVKVLEILKQENFLPDYAVVAEPTCEKIFGDAIKIGRRGSINGVIEKVGIQGHAAYPEKAKNPIHKVAAVLPYMAGVNLDNGDADFAPSQFVITDIRAGMEVTNVTPGKLKMMFNVRNSTKTSKEDIADFVHKYFKEMDYSLVLNQSAKPFVTNHDSKVVQQIRESIQNVVGVETKLSTAGGTSDARFFGEYGVDTVEFGVINDTIHAPNERTTIGEVKGLQEIFSDLITNF
ncbi:MAG: succinyl-diaminopimelate desuccinylase [Epsilonproteobacteria bacterium]|nr:succinyl-diaminopimelate desuccinylase [Campylobacterota bacterium]